MSKNILPASIGVFMLLGNYWCDYSSTTSWTPPWHCRRLVITSIIWHSLYLQPWHFTVMEESVYSKQCIRMQL